MVTMGVKLPTRILRRKYIVYTYSTRPPHFSSHFAQWWRYNSSEQQHDIALTHACALLVSQNSCKWCSISRQCWLLLSPKWEALRSVSCRCAELLGWTVWILLGGYDCYDISCLDVRLVNGCAATYMLSHLAAEVAVHISALMHDPAFGWV